MKLLIDVGNTCIKWATASDSHVTVGEAINYRENEFLTLLQYAWKDLPTPSDVLIANVASPSIVETLVQWIETTWSCSATLIHANAYAVGLENAYPFPEKLGVDRWLTMIAARQRYPQQPLAIFSCGTCITLDVISQEGKHVGGLIAPGIASMQWAVHQRTAVAQEECAPPTLDLAINTQAAIANGCTQMAIAFIERMSQQVSIQQGRKTLYLLTGGDAPRLLGQLNAHYHPNLVLEGLSILANAE